MLSILGRAKSQVRPQRNQAENSNKHLTQKSLIHLVVGSMVPIWWPFRHYENCKILQASALNVLLSLATYRHTYSTNVFLQIYMWSLWNVAAHIFGSLPIKSGGLDPFPINLSRLVAAPFTIPIRYGRSCARWPPKLDHKRSCIPCLVHGTLDYPEATMLKRLCVGTSVDCPNWSQIFKMPDVSEAIEILQGGASSIWTPPTNQPLLTPKGRRIIQPSPAWIPDPQYCKI